jgi:ribosomal protein S18 acetylase RimI-like enzyme
LVNVVYRALNKEDCKDVLSFWSNAPGVRLHKNGEDSVAGISAYLDRNPGFSFIAECDGQIVGAILCGHDGRRGYIHHLAVDSGYRRMGIGKKLLRLSVEQLKASNIKKTVLFLLKENDIGETFYKTLLWKEEDSVKIFAKVL